MKCCRLECVKRCHDSVYVWNIQSGYGAVNLETSGGRQEKCKIRQLSDQKQRQIRRFLLMLSGVLHFLQLKQHKTTSYNSSFFLSKTNHEVSLFFFILYNYIKGFRKQIEKDSFSFVIVYIFNVFGFQISKVVYNSVVLYFVLGVL